MDFDQRRLTFHASIQNTGKRRKVSTAISLNPSQMRSFYAPEQHKQQSLEDARNKPFILNHPLRR